MTEEMEQLANRLQQFKGKKVHELTDDQLHEFIELRRRFNRMVEDVKSIWDSLHKMSKGEL